MLLQRLEISGTGKSEALAIAVGAAAACCHGSPHAEADGAVCCGHCTCMAGLGEACSHVAALLFAVDCRNRMESEVTCTSVLCEWKKPPSKRVDCLPTSEIDFVSPKRKLSEPSKPSANKAKHICDPSESHLMQAALQRLIGV